MNVFPFDAVVGQDDAKLALRLAAADPLIGGVLLRGQKGSAKTTLARGLAGLLGGAPFVELPLGATEDRVVGTLDTHAALTAGEVRFQPGLLAAAHGGVLYVDEINLLADHLVDVLLDVAVSGENVVERDGISHRHPARFVLVGSMNPEEGELRPQLLDRFGLCVEVAAPLDIGERTESVRRRLAFDAGTLVDSNPPTVQGRFEAAALPDEIIEAASRLAVEVGAEGLRADLVLCRAAATASGLDGRREASLDDLRRVAPLVLAHRSRRGPFDPPVIGSDALERAMDEALDLPASGGDPEDSGGHSSNADHRAHTDDEPDFGPEPIADSKPEADGGADRDLPGRSAAERPLLIGAPRRPPVAPPVRAEAARGRVVGERRAEPGSGEIAVMPTVRALAARRATDPATTLQRGDLRTAVRADTKSRTIVLAVDLSGSMGAPDRAAAASGTVIGLLSDAYQRRDRVALVGFRGQGAEVLLSATSSVEVARNRLDGLLTGGTTPLAAGISAGLAVAETALAADHEGLLVVLTDGRATGSADALADALTAAASVRRRGIPAMVLDCETGPVRLGLAADLSEAMGARHVEVADLDPTTLARTIRGQR